MPSTMPDPSDPGVTTSISLIYRHAVFGFFQYEKGEVSPGAESRPDKTVALAKRGKAKIAFDPEAPPLPLSRIRRDAAAAPDHMFVGGKQKPKHSPWDVGILLTF